MNSFVGNNGDDRKVVRAASSRKGRIKGKGGLLNIFCTFKGVRQRKWGEWVSEIGEPKTGVRRWLGTFDTAREASLAYDDAARKLFGPDALLNLPDKMEKNQETIKQPSIPEVKHAVCENAMYSELPVFEDSAMWEKASFTMDYYSQAICDLGIDVMSFDDAIGNELNHLLMG